MEEEDGEEGEDDTEDEELGGHGVGIGWLVLEQWVEGGIDGSGRGGVGGLGAGGHAGGGEKRKWG